MNNVLYGFRFTPVLILNTLAAVQLSSFNSGQRLHPTLESMAVRIRKRRSELPDLSPFVVDPDLEAIWGKIDGEDLFIRNELHSCRGFRKLHLELAVMGTGLQILHCVFFPEPTFDLPIFGVDLVAGPGGISAAIVDLSPVRAELPESVLDSLGTLSIPFFSQSRELPSWGSIFSPYVRFVRPVSSEEEECFLDLVDGYLEILIASLPLIVPDQPDSRFTIERYQGQTSYCLQQKRNDKTRSVLAKAFDSHWADRYLGEVLFDMPPSF